jgi:cation:H+ antiporter
MTAIDTLWALALVLVGVGALWYGALVLVENATAIAARLGVSPVVVGVLVVGVGTSAPEVAVTAGAAFRGAADIAVANVVGSNFFNLGIVLGSVALVRALPVRGRILRRDGLVLFGASVVTLAFLADLRLARWEGVLLLVGLAGYLLLLLRQPRIGSVSGEVTEVADEFEEVAEELEAELRATPEQGVDWAAVAKVVLSLGLVVLGADVLVDGATTLALDAGISEWVVGLTVVAAGTSAPEFAASMVASQRGEHGLSVGNLVGSSVFNLLAVLGIAGLAGPLTLVSNARGGAIWMLGLVVLALVLLRSNRQLSRPEGGVLVLVACSRWALDLLNGPL